MSDLLYFLPQYEVPAPVAPDESLIVAQNSAANSVTPVITQDGIPATPDSLTIVTQPTHGTASVSGAALLYTPATGYNGADSFTYKATVSGTDSNVANVGVQVLALACTELGRITRIYASGYDRARVHDGRLVRGESRCLVVEFNGAIPAGRTVTSVTFRCIDPSVIVMSNARIIVGQRSVAIDVRANLPCEAAIKCEATLDNGERYMQLIRLAVMDSPWFGDETQAVGPMTLTSP